LKSDATTCVLNDPAVTLAEQEQAMPPTALVVVAHPAPDSLNHALAERVRRTWADAGLNVIVRDLHAEQFNPVLTLEEQRGSGSRDPVVQAHISDLRAADLLAVVHPNCWGAPPAIMKGWIDRVFAPEAAYAFDKGGDQGDTPTGLLRIRHAIVLNTGNTDPQRERETFGDPLDAIWRRCVLEYCGVARVERELFGVVATSSPEDRRRWLDRAAALASAALASDP
jgi:NAD(P)H dehydrogenase (quinone)